MTLTAAEWIVSLHWCYYAFPDQDKMDVHELKSLLELQNKSRELLQCLLQGQDQCRDVCSNTRKHDTHRQTSGTLAYPRNGSIRSTVLSNSGIVLERDGSTHNSVNGTRPAVDQHSHVSGVHRSESLSHGDCGNIDRYKIKVHEMSPGSGLSRKLISYQGAHIHPTDYNRPVIVTLNESVDKANTGQSDQILGDQELGNKHNTSVTFQDAVNTSIGSHGSHNTTSTPIKRPVTIQRETPRSILKRRQIIEDNVKVDSKYAPTPVTGNTPKHKNGLNFSYSNVDDLYITDQCHSTGKARYSDATDGSYIEEYCDGYDGDSQGKAEAGMVTAEESANSKNETVAAVGTVHDLGDMMQEKLLLDSGNDRLNARAVLDLSQRPKSTIFSTDPEIPTDTGNASTLSMLKVIRT